MIDRDGPGPDVDPLARLPRIPTPARDIGAGDHVWVAQGRHSMEHARSRLVAASTRSRWAMGMPGNPWWRLTFTDGYWVESAAAHRWPVVDVGH